MEQFEDTDSEFIEAASVPRNASHASGDLARAEEVRVAHPEVASSNIYSAAVFGDEEAVRRFIAKDPDAATRKGGPREWDPLTYLCFSRYLKIDQAKGPAFARAAKALLDAGADPNTGWFEKDHEPKPEWEGVLYGASGVAHQPDVTKLLLDRGADPNDGETVYHTPESEDLRSMKLLVETGKLTAESLALMLIRKHDWHDLEGVKYLLENGANPNHVWHWTPLLHGIMRDNDPEIIEISLDHGGDPTVVARGISGVQIAAGRGRSDLLELFKKRGFSIDLDGVGGVIADCAMGNVGQARKKLEADPALLDELKSLGGKVLALFAGNGNTDGVRALLDAGVDVNSIFKEGDGYFGIAENSISLHVAAWRAHTPTIKLLLERGASVNAKDGRDRTPLMLAVKACVDSYWTSRRTPDGVGTLLSAGASTEGVPYPCGYDKVDELLRQHGAS